MAKKKTSKGKIAAEISAGLAAAGAAAAASYYLYGSKNAKKNRTAVTKEIKKDWKIVQREAKQIEISDADIARAKVLGKKVLVRGKKAVKKIVKSSSRRSKTPARKSR